MTDRVPSGKYRELLVRALDNYITMNEEEWAAYLNELIEAWEAWYEERLKEEER